MLYLQNYFISVGTLHVVSVAGFLAYIFAFASVQMNWMDGNSIAYTLWSILEASLVGINLLAQSEKSFRVLNRSLAGMLAMAGTYMAFA